MQAAYLPGNSTVVLKEVEVPVPGHGEVLIKMKSSTICGSDIRAIYREHLGKGPEGYQNIPLPPARTTAAVQTISAIAAIISKREGRI
jgi:threonine dehydrogenase-like Zn-dependent dehydrogenase